MARAVGDTTIQWGADFQLTITLAALATDSNKLAGRESTAYDLSSLDNVEDLLISGKITTGTSPTASKSIEVWAVAPINDTPAWPDVFDGTDSAETIASSDIKASICRLVAYITTSNTSDRTYPFAPVSLRSLFGALPKQVVIFVTHDTGVDLNPTGGNHEISVQPIYRNTKLS